MGNCSYSQPPRIAPIRYDGKPLKRKSEDEEYCKDANVLKMMKLDSSFADAPIEKKKEMISNHLRDMSITGKKPIPVNIFNKKLPCSSVIEKLQNLECSCDSCKFEAARPMKYASMASFPLSEPYSHPTYRFGDRDGAELHKCVCRNGPQR